MAAYHEDVVDNWEDADTEDLERRMEERKNELKTELKVDNPPDTAQHKPESKEIEAQFVASLDPRLRIQDSERTQYVAPVKILKRTDATSGSPQGSSSPQQPGEEQKKYKSLAEREAEYASARARILGQSKPTGSQDVKILSTGQSQSSSPG